MHFLVPHPHLLLHWNVMWLDQYRTWHAYYKCHTSWNVSFRMCGSLPWKVWKSISRLRTGPLGGSFSVIKAGKFKCIQVKDELKWTFNSHLFLGSDKDIMMVTSFRYSLCSIREEFGKYMKFAVDIYVAMPSTYSVCWNVFTVTQLSCFMYYSVSSTMACIISVK